MSPYVKSVVADILLTLVTCGLFNIYIQYRQCDAVNNMIGRPKYNFILWFLFTLLTCGFYHIYHEYCMSSDIAEKLERDTGSAGLVAVVLSFFGLSIICDAIQQTEINRYYGGTDSMT